jgi:3'-phosphoadenosine 5'-phosphosulfate sulfotransferase (PAPS reductase)/FAD synthetase
MLFQPEQKPTNEPLLIGLPSATILQNPLLAASVVDFRNSKVMLGLSAGINSMAVLVWLAHQITKPKTIYIFYAHFKEHSPDSLEFVLAGVEYAKKHFENVVYEQTNNSVIDFFRQMKMIPHPTIAPCTRLLKIMPALEFASKHNCTVDLVGYVKNEMRRVKNMRSKGADNLFMTKHFPILHFTNEDCFDVVKEHIGFYPKIYDLRDAKGKRIFTHNNCLPCKNMQLDDYKEVQLYFPEYWQLAEDLAAELQKHWGRSKEDYYVSFGRQDFEVGYEKQICDVCAVS